MPLPPAAFLGKKARQESLPLADSLDRDRQALDGLLKMRQPADDVARQISDRRTSHASDASRVEHR